MGKENLAAVFLAAVMAASCSTPSDNPRQGGLVGGLQGIYGGGYNKRVEGKNDELSQQRRLHQDLELESSSLTREYQLADAKLVAEKEQMSKLNYKVQSLSSQVAELRSQSGREQDTVSRLKIRITEMQKKIREQHAAIDNLSRDAGRDVNQQKYRDVKAGREQLGAEYTELATEYRRVVKEENRKQQ